MQTDLAITVALSAALAGWVTDHVALAAGLLRRRPRWRGVLAFFVAPLAPVFGFGARLRIRSVLWIVLGVAYLALLARAYA